MTWQIFIGISMAADIAGRLIQRTLLKNQKSDPIVYGILFQLITGMFISIFAVFTGFHIPDISSIWINLVLTSVLYGASTIFIYKSLKFTEASIFTVLFSFRAVWIILGGIFVLNEVFLPIQMLGSLLILLSIIIVSWKKEAFRVKRGELYAILAAILFGAATVNDAFVLQTLDPTTYLTYGFIGPGLFIWLLFPQKTKLLVKTVKSKAVSGISLLSFVYGVSALGYLWAYKVGSNLAQIASIYQVSSILTIIFAILLLRERDRIWLKIFAGILSFVGVLLVT